MHGVDKKISAIYLKVVHLNNLAVDYVYFLSRRVVRFLSLPFCFVYTVNWTECKKNKISVIADFLYIFFVLKDYPDHYSLCRLWKVDKDKWKLYYGSIYNPCQRFRLRKNVQQKKYIELFENKYICHSLCQTFGLPVPEQYIANCSDHDFDEVVRNLFDNDPDGSFIVKPLQGKGGEGVCKIWQKGGKVWVHDGCTVAPLKGYPGRDPVVIQPLIVQHEALSKAATSVNTIRLVTFLTRSHDVLLLGAFIRFGAKGAIVDNTSKGGVAVNIDLSSGQLSDTGFDKNSKSHRFLTDTQFVFEGFEVPYWKEIVALTERVQRKFFFYKMLGVDVAITNDGPILVEINSSHDNVGLEQKCGPLLKRQQVFEEFKKENLLYR